MGVVWGVGGCKWNSCAGMSVSVCNNATLVDHLRSANKSSKSCYGRICVCQLTQLSLMVHSSFLQNTLTSNTLLGEKMDI